MPTAKPVPTPTRPRVEPARRERLRIIMRQAWAWARHGAEPLRRQARAVPRRGAADRLGGEEADRPRDRREPRPRRSPASPRSGSSAWSPAPPRPRTSARSAPRSAAPRSGAEGPRDGALPRILVEAARAEARAALDLPAPGAARGALGRIVALLDLAGRALDRRPRDRLGANPPPAGRPPPVGAARDRRPGPCAAQGRRPSSPASSRPAATWATWSSSASRSGASSVAAIARQTRRLLAEVRAALPEPRRPGTPDGRADGTARALPAVVRGRPGRELLALGAELDALGAALRAWPSDAEVLRLDERLATSRTASRR